MKNLMKKEELLRGLTEWLGSEIVINLNGSICVSYDDNFKDEFIDINSALISRLDDLVQADQENEDAGECALYTNEIKFIKSIKRGVEDCENVILDNLDLRHHIVRCLSDSVRFVSSEKGLRIECQEGKVNRFKDSRYEISDTYASTLYNLTLEELLLLSLDECMKQKTVYEEVDLSYASELNKSFKYVSEYYEDTFFVLEKCWECKHEMKLSKNYKVQECICGAPMLPNTHETHVIIEDIHEVHNVNKLDCIYDFQMFFDFENSKEVNEFLANEYTPYHLIYCEVEHADNIFDLNKAKMGVSWYAEAGCKYNFTPEQMVAIKSNVSKYISDKKMGIVRDEKVKLLEKICDNYGWALTVTKDANVLLSSLTNIEFENVKDALSYVYTEYYIKEELYRYSDEDIAIIRNILQEKALDAVLKWMNDYSFTLKESNCNGKDLEMIIIEDLTSYGEDDNTIVKTLNYWCEYFIGKIISKKLDSDSLEIYSSDLKAMQEYLYRYKCLPEIGELMVEAIKEQEAYKDIVWNEFDDENCRKIAEKLMSSHAESLDFIKSCESKTYQESTCKFIMSVIDNELDENYYWHDGVHKFKRRKSIEKLGEVFLESDITFNCYYDDHSVEMIRVPLKDGEYLSVDAYEQEYNVVSNKNHEDYFIDSEIEVVQYIQSKLESSSGKSLDLLCGLLNQNAIYYSVIKNSYIEVELSKNNTLQIHVDKNMYIVKSNKDKEFQYSSSSEDFIGYIMGCIKEHEYDDYDKEDNENEEKCSMETQLKVSFDNKLQAEFKEGKYIVTTSLPIMVSREDIDDISIINTLTFDKIGELYHLNSVLTIDGEFLSKSSVKYFIGIGYQELYNACYDICEQCVASYLKIGNEKYLIDNAKDFLELQVSKDVMLKDVEYRFNGEHKIILNNLLEANVDLTLHEAQKCLKDNILHCDNNYLLYKDIVNILTNMNINRFDVNKILIGSSIDEVAKDYAEKILNIDSDFLKFADYVRYFRNRVKFKLIEGYIVVLL